MLGSCCKYPFVKLNGASVPLKRDGVARIFEKVGAVKGLLVSRTKGVQMKFPVCLIKLHTMKVCGEWRYSYTYSIKIHNSDCT
jgi:hypothetical protein